jgi:tripartite ATP-independent transporter DctM subunit
MFGGVNLVHRRTSAATRSAVPLRVKLASLRDLVPTLLLIVVVLGTIYGGIATPTESAAIGVVGAIGLALWDRRLSWKLLNESAEATARTTAMLGLILISAFVLNFVLTSIYVPQTVAGLIAELPLPPWATMLIIIAIYLALGTFMEGLSMVVTTLPVVFPVVVSLGYDPVWFGVIVTMMVEIAIITPPDGTVLYVLQGLRPQAGPITDVFIGVMPYVGAYLLAVLALLLAPELALWLPE